MYDTLTLIFIYGALTVIMILIPLIPVGMAIKEKKDINPLRINFDYIKDPRAIAGQFKVLFKEDYDEKELIAGNTLTGKRFGKLTIIGEEFEHKEFTNLVCITERTTVPSNTHFDQELVAKKDLILSSGCHAKAIYAPEKLTLGEECCVSRWIDTKGRLTIKNKSQINIASSSSTIHLEPQVSFSRLYGFPIMTSSQFTYNHDLTVLLQTHEVAAQIEKNLLYLQKENHTMEEKENVFQSMVLAGKLHMKSEAKVFGDIKANDDVVLEKGCVVDGNIICEGDIIIGEGCFVTGDLFSRKSITIHKDTQIGTDTRTKSVIAKGKITLHEHIAIFNYILTDTRGYTV